MKIKCLYSTDIYEKILSAPADKREDIFRYELMQPFQGKWDCYQIPLKAKVPGGYDVIMASEMLGILTPKKLTTEFEAEIDLMKDHKFWDECTKSVTHSLQYFEDHGVELKVKDYIYTMLLADPDSIYTKLSDGYSGDGGIPGFITAYLLPKKETMQRIPTALAHECNHNVRFQYIAWSQNITLGEMMVSEGLAENYAVSLYGIENLGPWVSKVSMDELNDYIKPLVYEGLNAQGLDNITAYLYGDDIAVQRGYIPVGLPFCAGYACGYYMVKYYLEKTGDDIAKATIRPASEILSQIQEFWKEE